MPEHDVSGFCEPVVSMDVRDAAEEIRNTSDKECCLDRHVYQKEQDRSSEERRCQLVAIEEG